MGKVRQAVIMVGGKGTRLRPLTDTCPKPILPVLDRPCLDYLVESLAKGGVEEIILACGYRSEQVPLAIGDGSDRNISIEYSYEDVPMGTAGAIKILEDRLDDVFIGVNGDMFAEIDVKKQIDEHFSSGACITIALTPVENPCEFGIARVDETGRILEFKEKPKPEEVFSNLINAGLYVVNKDVMKLVP
jgi:Nucleoside-diphosphate-sugar pyrophosphorylase involved in lipopolysaccharide biosynthesis/translation initiation factor 2B, gamma/epsilon subunits (eIF-2Bgamma/eIF-2Bepsilon)